MTVDLLQKELIRVTAQSVASKAPCAVMRAAAEPKAEFDQEKLKSRPTVKASARHVTHAAIRAQQAAEQKQAQKEREPAQKEVQKKAGDAALLARIKWEMRNRTFIGTS
jgi:hypothetical protein